MSDAAGIERLAEVVRDHEPETGHRECYCMGCGKPIGDWGQDWPEHIAAALLAALPASASEAALARVLALCDRMEDSGDVISLHMARGVRAAAEGRQA